MIGYLIYSFINKSDNSDNSDNSDKLSAIYIALKKGGLIAGQGQENFAYDGIYDSYEKILSNFEDFINTYFPKINLIKINHLLKNYYIELTIQEIMKQYIHSNISDILMQILSGSYFSLIRTYENNQELGNLALIGSVLLFNLLVNDPTFKEYDKYKDLNVYLSYNTNYKTINELRLYFNTSINAGKEGELVSIGGLAVSEHCLSNLCYTNINKVFGEDKNSIEFIKNYYNDIENEIYTDFINRIKNYINISDDVKNLIISNYEKALHQMNTIDYKSPK